MPVPSGVARLRGLSVLGPVGDLQQFRIALEPFMRRRGMVVERAEPPREGEMLVRCPGDVAKNDDVVTVPNLADGRDRVVAYLFGDIDAADFRAKRMPQRNDFHIYPTSARSRSCRLFNRSSMGSTPRAPDWKIAVAFSVTYSNPISFRSAARAATRSGSA